MFGSGVHGGGSFVVGQDGTHQVGGGVGVPAEQGVDLRVADRGAVLVIGFPGKALVDEGVIGVSAAGQRHVGHRARGVLTQYGDGGVRGDALSGVHGGRIAQGHVLGDTVGKPFAPSRFGLVSIATTCRRLPLHT
jgi:hypothetical protein